MLGYTILEHKLIVMGYTILWDIMGHGIFIFILWNRFAVAGFFGDDQGVISIKQFLEIHALESVLILQYTYVINNSYNRVINNMSLIYIKIL